MTHDHVLELKGIDGSNPLGFLAALGTLRALSIDSIDEFGLSWSADQRPIIHSATPLSSEQLSKLLLQKLRSISESGIASFGSIISVGADVFDSFVHDGLVDPDPRRSGLKLTFAAAYGSSAVLGDAKEKRIAPNLLSFSNGQGGKLLLKDFQTLVASLSTVRIDQALFATWKYEDQELPTFRWDPQDMRTGAHMASDPGSTPTRSVAAANALGFIGMSFLVSVPTVHGLKTALFRKIDGSLSFTWPLWSPPLNSEVVSSLLQQPKWDSRTGVFACFVAPRISYKKNLYLGNAVAMDGSFLKE